MAAGGDGGRPVVVIGGGVVGCAVAHALARCGVAVVLVEARDELALGASGANSGILHTGFDSTPGELETTLILRAAQLRDELAGELGVAIRHCGAVMRPLSGEQRDATARLAANAQRNGVPATLDGDGVLEIPGEALTDPVAFTEALAGAAQAGGARVLLGRAVNGLAPTAAGGVTVSIERGETVEAAAAVNCAGLFADEIGRLAGDDAVPEIYPRKGEFLVLDAAGEPEPEQILLPVPSSMGKGVLVFGAAVGRVIAGPTARERTDKRDLSVEGGAAAEIVERALPMYEPLARMTPLETYAGLRPAGRDANYAIGLSHALPGLLHVAAIRSTGLSASLGIGEHATQLLAGEGLVALGAPRALPAPPPRERDETWWERAAARSGAGA